MRLFSKTEGRANIPENGRKIICWAENNDTENLGLFDALIAFTVQWDGARKLSDEILQNEPSTIKAFIHHVNFCTFVTLLYNTLQIILFLS